MRAIPPGAWLGLLGGGQLGRMFCMAAQSLGYKVVVLDPGADSPAGSVADRHIAADYLDPGALAELAAIAAAATTEFENVPASALEFLARTARVTPAAASVAIAQDRISEKMFLSGHGFAVAPFAVLRSDEDAASVAAQLLPGIVKSARFGYDGKGQARVRTREDVAAAWRRMRGQPCVLEQHDRPRLRGVGHRRPQRARRSDDVAGVGEPAPRRHPRRVDRARAGPAPISRTRRARSRRGVAAALDYRGVLCVELFVARDGALLVNEIAPRPHNSGHYSIDACVTSQFEQQARVLADLPLGDTRQHTPAVMVNLLGDLWFASAGSDTPREPPWADVLRHPRRSCTCTARPSRGARARWGT